MAVPVPRRLFTVDEYYRMAEAGILKPDERVELLDGEIVAMNPIGSPHAWCVTRLAQTFGRLGERVVVSVQNPIRLGDFAEPEPDIAVIRLDAPQDRHPGPPDILLIIEVADTSILVDCGRKRAMYARAGIAEYWIVDLTADRIEVYRRPAARGYQSTAILARGESVNPLCAPDLTVEVTNVLGQQSAAE